MHGTLPPEPLEFVPFAPSHLEGLALQQAQVYEAPLLADPTYTAALAVPDLSWSGIRHGRVVGCAGILPMPATKGTGRCWAILGDIPRGQWPRITKMVRRVMALAHFAGLWRLEAAVHAEFAAGNRWVELMGFAYEGTAIGSDQWGNDYRVWAHIDRIALAAARAAARPTEEVS